MAFWDPSQQAWPGGPHPGEIAAMQAAEAARIADEERASRQRTAFLLLLGNDASPVLPHRLRRHEAAR